MELYAFYELTNSYPDLDACVYRDYHENAAEEMLAEFKKLGLGADQDLAKSKELVQKLLDKFTPQEKVEYGNLLLKFLESSSSAYAKELHSFIIDIIFNADNYF